MIGVWADGLQPKSGGEPPHSKVGAVRRIPAHR